MRLNGWQRLGVVLSVAWLPVGFYLANSYALKQGDWAIFLLQECLKLRADTSNCSAEFGKNWAVAMEYHWQIVALLVALPFVLLPILWYLFRGLRSVICWVVRGFNSTSPP